MTVVTPLIVFTNYTGYLSPLGEEFVIHHLTNQCTDSAEKHLLPMNIRY